MTGKTGLGTTVYNTTNTEVDRRNTTTGKQEQTRHDPFKQLVPGTALLNLRSGTVIEFLPPKLGSVMTTEGLFTDSEEYQHWKYGNKKGQNWGGIQEHFYVTYTKRTPTGINDHHEITVPTDQPAPDEITHVKPDTFESQVLSSDGEPIPFLLLERSEINYHETNIDTYQINGYYDTTASSDNRVSPITAVVDHHPELFDIDHNKTIYKKALDGRVPQSKLDKHNFVIIGDNHRTTQSSDTAEVTITIRTAFQKQSILIDSPFDAKETIKDLPYNTRWDNDSKQWAVVGQTGEEQLLDVITALDDWEIALSTRVFDAISETEIETTLNEPVPDNPLDELHTEIEQTIPTQVQVTPETEPINIDSHELLAITTGDTTTVEPATSTGEVHIDQADTETATVVCNREHASIIKQLDWETADYKWHQENQHWTLNIESTTDLIQLFINNNVDLTISTEIASQIEVDNSESENTDDSTTQSSSSDQHSYPTQNDTYTTTTLDGIAMILESTNTSPNFGVDLGQLVTDDLSDRIIAQWTVSEEDTTITFYNTRTTEEIHVETTSNWGDEYKITIEDSQTTTTLGPFASEETTVTTVLEHINAMSR